MRDDFTRNFVFTVILILALFIPDHLPGLMGRTRSRRYIQKVVQSIHNANLNREDFDALAAGYYEGLWKDAGPMAGLPAETDDVKFRDDFLRYELRANVRRAYPAGMRITNQFGMQNPEYLPQKPPHTRRVAVFGDSMSLGPFGQDYVARLENLLNESYLTPEVQRYQILNFSAYGYSVLQMMDVALEKAPVFHPDVYLLALTDLEIIADAGWRTHVGRLILSGTDLKYDFLRRAVAQAKVQPNDHLPKIRRKLSPFLLPVIRSAVEQIRDHAASQGAQMIIVLVASPIDPKFTETDFNIIHRAVDGVGVPIVDLRDTFKSQRLNEVQVLPMADFHPNARGHELIFENLYAKLRGQPAAWAALVGSGAN